ncbi:MAG: tetratricopeptide repeat protein, partial [Bacteroidota bacterium]
MKYSTSLNEAYKELNQDVPDIKKVKSICQKVKRQLSSDSLKYAEAESYLAWMYSHHIKKDSTKYHAEKASQLLTARSDSLNISTLRTLVGLGNAYFNIGDFSNGLTFFERAQNIHQQSDKSDTKLKASIVKNLGVGHLFTGEMNQGRDSLIQANKTLNQLDVELLELANVNYYLSIFHYYSNHIDSAYLFCERATGFCNKAPEETAKQLTDVLAIKAMLKQEEELFGEALKLVDTAIAICNAKKEDVFQIQKAYLLYNKGEIYTSQDRYDLALEPMEDAVTIAEKVLDAQNGELGYFL